MLESVLVANRGEIAVRILRTCRRLGVRSVAVHSDADADAPFVRLADDAVRIGPAPAAASYLDVARIVAAALATGAQAVHPGYGFLSENPALPRALAEAGVGWVGPDAEVIALMADKSAAKTRMADAGVPVVPGIDDPSLADDELLARLDEVGFPLLLKAVAGGGGKGMRVVHDPDDAPAALAAARREAANAVGDDRMIVERLVTAPRHVEVQVIGDLHGTVRHVLERDCSIQRRHQKVVEEAPAAHLREDVRAGLLEAAVTAAATVGYVGAGTVEFLLDGDGETFHFIEMNTRLQVEHPVTEMITGIDLVEQQLRVAAGERLSFDQEDVVADGHAVEVRLYAEDPRVGFLPQTGTLHRFEPDPAVDGGADVRLDSGVVTGSTVTPHYDPMLAKLVAHGSSRADALTRLRTALRGTTVLGVTTNAEWLGDLLGDPAVAADEVTTSWLDDWSWTPRELPTSAVAAAAAAAVDGAGPDDPASPWEALGPVRPGAGAAVCRLGEGDHEHRAEVRRAAGADRVTVVEDLVADLGHDHLVEHHDDGLHVRDDRAVAEHARDEDHAPTAVVRTAIVGDDVWLHVLHEGHTRRLAMLPATRHLELGAGGGEESLASPMPGSVVSVEVAEGDHVAVGDVLLVVEAMKMEHPITASADGTVSGLRVAAGDAVEAGEPLVTVQPDDH